MHQLTPGFFLDERLKPLVESLNLFPRSSDLEKRDGIQIKKDLELKPFYEDSKSYSGFVSVDDITGIQTGDGGASTRTLVKDVASYGYIDLTCEYDSPNLVAALYVPTIGVFVGSIPRSKGTASKLFGMAEKYPDYSKLLSYRLGGASPDQMDYEKFHAEDMAISNAISKMAETMDAEEIEGMLKNSKIAIWGKYSKSDKEGHKSPCGTTGDSKMNPSCLTVLRELGIKHV